MMKKLTLGFFISAMVLFTGCSQKDVEVTEENTSKAQSSEESTTESSQVASSVEGSSTNESSEMKALKGLNNIYFDFDKYVIRDNMRPVLKANYMAIKQSGYEGTISLEGHCDERGSNEYNFALGLKRASTVKSELIEHGVNPSQIKVISYGENKPLCTDKTENCWAKNRRVEIVGK